MGHIAEVLDTLEDREMQNTRLGDIAFAIADHLRALTREIKLSRQLEMLKARREVGLITEAEYRFGLEALQAGG